MVSKTLLGFSSTEILTLTWVGDNLLPCWFSLNNSEMVKTVTLSNILLDTFLPNLVSLPRPSLQILGKTQMGVFPISGFLVNPLQTKIVITPEPVMNWHETRTST